MNSDKQLPLAAPKDRMATRAIRTFLAEDSPLMTAALARILAKDERITIVGSATDGWNAVHSASLLKPDLVLMDLHLPRLHGAEATRLLKQLPRPPAVFVVTSDDSPGARARSLATGADAFLVKTAKLAQELLSTIDDFFGNDLEVRNRKPSYLYEPTAPTR